MEISEDLDDSADLELEGHAEEDVGAPDPNHWSCQYAALRQGQVEWGEDDLAANEKRLAFFNKLLAVNKQMNERWSIPNLSSRVAACRKKRGCGNRRRCFRPVLPALRAAKNLQLTNRYIAWAKRTLGNRKKYLARDVKYYKWYQAKCNRTRA